MTERDLGEDRTRDQGQDSEVAAVIEQLYGALGDRPAFDRHLHPDITIWESDAEEMLRGTAELDRLRDTRADAEGAERPVRVAAESLLTDIWGETAVARYMLRVAHAAPARPDTCFRVTDVLRRTDRRWLIVHHHSEAIVAGGQS